MIQKITRIALREAFPRENTDFTRWLEENLDVLNEVTDLNLANAERERPAGDFSVDLVAEDENGSKVIIENQLERSNHDHLGKLITYLVATEARAAVWIVSDPRPEHASAVTWLNESSSASFYLVKLEAIQIGESLPAPVLILIVGQSAEANEIAKAKTKLYTGIAPGRHSWIGTGAGKRGLGYNYVIREHESSVELYIDRGKEGDKENKFIFDTLHEKKSEIEKIFGDVLEWERLDNKRASRIRKTINKGGWKDDDKWAAVNEATVDAMIRLEKALRPHVQKLEIESI